MSTNKQKISGSLLLLLTALIWGVAFVAQDEGVNFVGPYTFQAARTVLGAAALLLLCAGRMLLQKKRGCYTPAPPAERKTLLIGGVACGLVLGLASMLQQLGIANNTSSPGKDAFITALYIVFVPLLGLFLGKRSQWHVYLCVGVALGGLWLLCMGGSTISAGDIQLILCSLAFSVHILTVGYFSPRVDGLWLSAIQFSVSALFCSVLMLIFEKPDFTALGAAWLPLLYAGLCSTAGGYTLQVLGMRHSPPTLASLVMSMESVFAVVASMILLPGVPAPTAREWIGMAIILLAIVAAQIPLPQKEKSFSNLKRKSLDKSPKE